MAILSTDILFKLSNSTSPGNSTAGTPATSLGGYISTTQVSGTPLDNLFADLSGDDNANSVVDYRCLFVHNNHGSLTLQTAVVWLSAIVGGGTTKTIAVDSAGITALASSPAQAAVIGSRTSAPSGVGSFSAPTTKGAGLSLGNIGPGQVCAIWVKRAAANTSALNNDGITISVGGDTAA